MSSKRFHLIIGVFSVLGALLLNSSCTSLFAGRNKACSAECGKRVVTQSPKGGQRHLGSNEPNSYQSDSKERIAATVRATSELRLKPTLEEATERAKAISRIQSNQNLTKAIPEVQSNQNLAEEQHQSFGSRIGSDLDIIHSQPPPAQAAAVPDAQFAPYLENQAPVLSETITHKQDIWQAVDVAPLPVEPNRTIFAAKIPEDAPQEEPRLPGEPIVMATNNSNRIISANGSDVEISGNDGVIVITGGCGVLTLSGGGNQVQCDSAATIRITGSVNTLVLGVLGEGSITGNRNIVSWGAGFNNAAPIVTSSGEFNEIERLE